MKKTEFYRIQGDKIHFVNSDNIYNIRECKKTEVVINPIRKGGMKTIANAATNALTNSIANGDEQVVIILRVTLENAKEDIVLNDEPLVRGNLDYHEMIEHARNLQKVLKRDTNL